MYASRSQNSLHALLEMLFDVVDLYAELHMSTSRKNPTVHTNKTHGVNSHEYKIILKIFSFLDLSL